MKVILTDHVKYRLLERNIDTSLARRVAKNGKKVSGGKGGRIAKQMVLEDGRILEVIVDEKRIEKSLKITIITAYYEN